MKGKLIAVCVLLCFLLSGCSMKLSSPQNLIRPPRPAGENAGIQEALEATVKKGFTLKSPQEGEYRSAYVVKDLNHDGVEEALVFYQPQRMENQVNMNLIQKVDGKWESRFDITGKGSDINSISFADMNQDDYPEVIISWSMYNDKEKKVLTVYSCYNQENKDLQFSLLTQFTYTNMCVLDMDGDGNDEILAFDIDSTSTSPSANASLLKMDEKGKIQVQSTTKLDGGVTSYPSIVVEEAHKGISGRRVFLDGIKGEKGMVTEVVVWDEESKKIKSPLLDARLIATNLTSRSNQVNCQDINQDGWVEIPIPKAMVGWEDGDSNVSIMLTQWMHLDGVELDPTLVTAINSSDFYMFEMPEKWVDRVTVRSDVDKRLWTFYEWDFTKQALSQELISIKTMTKSEWEKNPLSDYKLLRSSGNLVYVAKISSFNNELSITMDEIKNLLRTFS